MACRKSHFTQCYRSVACLSVCLSVTLAYCGQTVGWIKLKLGIEVGLDPSHIVLDGNPVPLPKGAQPPIFAPCLLWPNGWLDQDGTGYGGRSQPRRHCVRWGPRSPSRKRGQSPPPIFNFRPTSIVAKRLDGSRCHMIRK